MPTEQELDLRLLGNGAPGLTPAAGSSLAEAGGVCLYEQGHAPGCTLDVSGTSRATYSITWEVPGDQALMTWNDEREATEAGACGIALLVARDEGYTVASRSRQGTGFDYWLTRTEDGPPFSDDARLEVSGIRNGSAATVRNRVRKKREQITRYESPLPGLVVVVEFGDPRAVMEAV